MSGEHILPCLECIGFIDDGDGTFSIAPHIQSVAVAYPVSLVGQSVHGVEFRESVLLALFFIRERHVGIHPNGGGAGGHGLIENQGGIVPALNVLILYYSITLALSSKYPSILSPVVVSAKRIFPSKVIVSPSFSD